MSEEDKGVMEKNQNSRQSSVPPKANNNDTKKGTVRGIQVVSTNVFWLGHFDLGRNLSCFGGIRSYCDLPVRVSYHFATYNLGATGTR